MAGLLDRVKTAVAEALQPQRSGESKELAYLREIFYKQQGNTQRNQWYRILNQSGDNVGFEFCCACGISYQLLHVADWLRQNTCPTCKTQFDLLKTCGITTETPSAAWPQHFAKLPARPRLSGAKRSSPFVDTWNDSAGDVQYERTSNEGWV